MSEDGRWVYVPHDTGHGVVGHVETSQGLVLAEVRTTSEIAGDHDEAHERGRVMAAAKEMLAALELARDRVLHIEYTEGSHVRMKVDAAIAKAKEETFTPPRTSP